MLIKWLSVLESIFYIKNDLHFILLKRICYFILNFLYLLATFILTIILFTIEWEMFSLSLNIHIFTNIADLHNERHSQLRWRKLSALLAISSAAILGPSSSVEVTAQTSLFYAKCKEMFSTVIKIRQYHYRQIKYLLRSFVFLYRTLTCISKFHEAKKTRLQPEKCYCNFDCVRFVFLGLIFHQILGCRLLGITGAIVFMTLMIISVGGNSIMVFVWIRLNKLIISVLYMYVLQSM